MLRLALIENLRRVAARRRRGHASTAISPTLGRPDDRDRRERSEEPDPGARRHGALESADDERLRRRSSRAACRDRARRWRCRSPGSSSGSPSRASRSSSSCRPRTSSRPPTRSRSATASAACASSARWTGASSSRRMSVVEQTLRDDPAGVYRAMDFATRDRYRHAVEELARHSTLSRGRSRAHGGRSSRASRSRERSARSAQRTSATT